MITNWQHATVARRVGHTGGGGDRDRYRDRQARYLEGVRVGIAHHLGWAVAVTASATHDVVDRRRIELLEPGQPPAPVEHETELLSDDAAAGLVAQVRASAMRAASASLDQLAASLPAPVVSLSLRAWQLDFPDDIAVQRRPPYAARADSVMYCQVLAEYADHRGWEVHLFDAKDVEAQATRILGPRASDVLTRPRAELGPPWTRDHRIALAATIVAGRPPSTSRTPSTPAGRTPSTPAGRTPGGPAGTKSRSSPAEPHRADLERAE